MPMYIQSLAESYYNVFKSVEAEKWYAKALETSEVPETIFKYAQMLKGQWQVRGFQFTNDKICSHAACRPQSHRFFKESKLFTKDY